MYMKALELDSKHVGSLTNLGVAYINKKDYDKAIAQFLRVCEQRPGDANNFVNVGVAYANKKDYAAALASFDKALAIDPNHQVAKQMHRRCLSDQVRRGEERSGANYSCSSPCFFQRKNRQKQQREAMNGTAARAPPARFDPNNGVSQHTLCPTVFSPISFSQELPACVVACVQYLEREEEASNLLIFQEQGDPAAIADAKRQFDAGARVDLLQLGSHNVAGLLWLWFHELPEPLLTHALRERWLQAAALANEGGHRALAALQDCVGQLLPGSRAVLHALLELLATIHTYQNAAARLGAFFAQELLWPPPGLGSANDPRAARVVELLILYYADLFQGSALANVPPMTAAAPAHHHNNGGGMHHHSNSSSNHVGSNGSGVGFGGALPGFDAGPQQPDPFGYYEPEIVFKVRH